MPRTGQESPASRRCLGESLSLASKTLPASHSLHVANLWPRRHPLNGHHGDDGPMNHHSPHVSPPSRSKRRAPRLRGRADDLRNIGCLRRRSFRLSRGRPDAVLGNLEDHLAGPYAGALAELDALLETPLFHPLEPDARDDRQTTRTHCYDCSEAPLKNATALTYHRTLADRITNVVCPSFGAYFDRHFYDG